MFILYSVSEFEFEFELKRLETTFDMINILIVY